MLPFAADNPAANTPWIDSLDTRGSPLRATELLYSGDAKSDQSVGAFFTMSALISNASTP